MRGIEYLLLCFFCLLLPVISISQNYIPMLGDTTEWYYVIFDELVTTTHYIACEDTVLFSENYKILREPVNFIS